MVYPVDSFYLTLENFSETFFLKDMRLDLCGYSLKDFAFSYPFPSSRWITIDIKEDYNDNNQKTFAEYDSLAASSVSVFSY